MPKTKIRFEDLEQGLTAPIAITSNSVNAVSVDGNTFSVDALNNRVGIGTATPSQKLEISGGSTMIDVNQSHYLGGQTDLGIDGTRLVSTGGDTYLDNKGTGAIHFRNDNIFGATDRMIILNNGNVGIGTTTPNAPLQFSNVVNSRKIVLFETANNDNEFFGLGINGGMLRYQVGNSADRHAFYAATGTATSVELMTINGNGNVGIGTTAPTAKLQVVGLTIHANNAAAISAGLTAGAFYHNGDGILRVVF